MENNSNNDLKNAKSIILSSNVNWIVRNEESDIINLVYNENWEKASCCTSCCLGVFFMPIWIIYAILWWKKGIKKQINIHYINGEITLSWDPQFLIKIFNLLKKSEIWINLKENENLIKAKKSEIIKNIIIVIWIILLFLILLNIDKNV